MGTNDVATIKIIAPAANIHLVLAMFSSLLNPMYDLV